MVLQVPASNQTFYPDSDGKPMADNTKQFRWIVTIQQNLDWLYADDPQVFVAGDLLWYPVEGRNNLCTAPDVMVVFGRPKGDRGSYQQWREEQIAPQVVFEILSPSNTQTEMEKKLLFYERYGVEEYYIYNPDTYELRGWLQTADGLDAIDTMQDWVSPRLNIKFHPGDSDLDIDRPDSTKFFSYAEIAQQLEQAAQQLEQTTQQLEQERQRAEAAEAARQQAIPKLLALGLSVEQIAATLDLPLEAVQQIAQQP